MKHLLEYIAGLNMAILAGVDVRFLLNGKSVPAVSKILINEQDRCLDVFYRKQGVPFDQFTQIPASTKFTVALNDRPDDLRAAGWE